MLTVDQLPTCPTSLFPLLLPKPFDPFVFVFLLLLHFHVTFIAHFSSLSPSHRHFPKTMDDFEELQKMIFTQLEKELGPDLYFHNVNHTRVDVLPAAEKLARLEKLSPEDAVIVRTAALFHDVGYLDVYSKNEPFGCKRAKSTLPSWGYSEEQIEAVCECIMATQLPQSPKTHNAQILCDADLSHLGSKEYFLRAERLRLELAEHGVVMTQRKWQESNIGFLKSHQYFTESAKKEFSETKEENIKQIEDLLGQKE
eukprot:TRINITY_DN4037_c0_g1_i1.p1 TRINITY_DN4037_c0_g1~~TRINITY_DN4037_c0_g1_i1.p1  ORF type:complete len:255 (+),score=75.76 TRINITY_DN4037_c0_g1_i1:102-866(+)